MGEDTQATTEDEQDGDEWTPTTATLRDGELPDLDAHARRNLEQVLEHVDELDADADEIKERFAGSSE